METEAQSSLLDATKTPPLSKNKLKKLKRDREWEENRAKRKARRKEKVQEKKLQRKRAALDEADPKIPAQPSKLRKVRQGDRDGAPERASNPQYSQLPVTLVLDCDFDDLMIDKERKSLGAQITRCYSDNHKAPYQAHLAISSFGGHLKERFDGVLNGQYHSWKNVQFLEEDFVEAARQAKEWMKGESGGRLAGIWADKYSSEQAKEGQAELGEFVYLTSDSPNTLHELRPYSTYVIGGLVDRNRHKGVCYKKAMDRGIRTAKLPIGDYMEMDSRFVLATNHVVEIMLRWLEFGDWGKAFLQVVPKRKGGTLKTGLAGDESRVDDRLVERAQEQVHAEEDEQVDEELDGKTEPSRDAEDEAGKAGDTSRRSPVQTPDEKEKEDDGKAENEAVLEDVEAREGEDTIAENFGKMK